MYTYIAKVLHIVDGDTLDVEIELGFKITQRMRLRLNGINTPEVRGKTKIAGLKSKQFVIDELEAAKIVVITTYKQGKYGRYITDLYYHDRKILAKNIFKRGKCLNKVLLKKKLAKKVFCK